jgi:hypothetical protein
LPPALVSTLFVRRIRTIRRIPSVGVVCLDRDTEEAGKVPDASLEAARPAVEAPLGVDIHRGAAIRMIGIDAPGSIVAVAVRTRDGAPRF